MFKKVLGLLVVLSVVIGGGTVLQAVGGKPTKTKDEKVVKTKSTESSQKSRSNPKKTNDKDKGDLTLINILKNAEYNTQYGRVRFKNGIYEKPYPNSASVIHVGIYKNMIVLGNLNNDDEKDAILIIDSYGGGSGHFYELAVVVNNHGKMIHLTSADLGDRVVINSISINEEREIILSMVTHGPNDALCCPTLKKIVRYKLYENKLLEVK